MLQELSVTQLTLLERQQLLVLFRKPLGLKRTQRQQAGQQQRQSLFRKSLE